MRIIKKWGVDHFVFCVLLILGLGIYIFFEETQPLSEENLGALDAGSVTLPLAKQVPQNSPCITGTDVTAGNGCQPAVAVRESLQNEKPPSNTMGIPAQLRLASKCRGANAAEIEKSGIDCRQEIQEAANTVKQLEERFAKGDGRSASELGNELRRNIAQNEDTVAGKEYKNTLIHVEEVLYQAATSGDKAAAMAYYSKERASVE